MKKFLAVLLAFLLFAGPAFAGIRTGDGRKTVASAGTAEALSATSTDFTTLIVTAETDNTGIITISEDAPIAALGTREGTPLSAGDSRIFDSYGNLTSVKIDSTVSTDGVTYEWKFDPDKLVKNN